MRRRLEWLVGLACILVIGCPAGEDRPRKQYTIEQFVDTESIFGSAFSPDESAILFTSNASGVYNAYTIPVTGGEPTQLTHSEDDAIIAISFFPEDRRALYRSDRGGNEIWHLYVREEDGSTTELTPGERVRIEFYQWSFDQESFFYGSNARDPKFMDLYEMDVATFTAERIFRNDAGYTFGAISDDERYLALSKTRTRDDSDIYLYDTQTGTIKHLTPHTGDVNHFPVMFSRDSRSLYFRTDQDHEFLYLKRYDIATGTSETVEKADWDIAWADLSRSGRYRVIGINQDARILVKIFDTEKGQPVALPDFPQGDITSANISQSEGLMTFHVNGSRSPNNLYIYDFGANRYRKLTETLNPEIDPDDLVEAEVVRYPSFDGLKIPAILYKPHHVQPYGTAPGVIWVHGGPGGQSRLTYNARLQYLANHGYVVLAVNNRGSSGYGKTFFQLDDRKHGQADLDDCVWAKKYLVSSGLVDENKVAIAGGSYGGYMVVAALAFRPEVFAAGVDVFGVTNWVRTLKSIPAWWESYREALYKELGNPETEEAYLRSISPLFHADKITRPLIVLQGANDPRVLKSESDEIVEAARKNGVPVEYLVFEDEGHGFRNKDNQIEAWKAILAFLDRHVKGGSTGAPSAD